MDCYKVRSIVIFAFLFFSSVWALKGTKGTPIGGMGTGYVLFDAVTGDFAASGKVPPPASDGVSEFSNKKSSSSGFHLFAGGQAITKAKTANEDARCPLYWAQFEKVGDVTFTLNAFGPFIPGDADLYAKLAHLPLAYFEMTAVNSGAAAVEAAVAMEFSNKTGSADLLGGANIGTNDAAANNKAISFDGTANTGNAYLQVDCDIAGAIFSAGALDQFATTGALTNGAGNLVAAKCSIPANGTARFKFVLSWWRLFVSTVDRYKSGKVDEDNYYYHNYFNDSKAAGAFGMENFDAVAAGVKSKVQRILDCNFPDWYRDRLLNNTYPLIHNASCAKDGRVAFWEGRYPIIGTIDQGEHASLWYSFNWPDKQWRELQYWLRTAHKGVSEDSALKGQIHHDFNIAPNNWTADAHFMCPWDNYLRDDYWWVPNTTNWSDLNSMAIFKAYELLLATGNLDSMKIYFPKVKLTADRLIRQSQAAGKHIPTTSNSTYDAKDLITPQYASGTALTAYLAMVEMAKFVGEDSVAARFKDWYDLARTEFRSVCNNADFGTGRAYCEGDVAGYSWARYFGFPAIQDSDFIATGCKSLWSYYSALSGTREKLGQWHFYTFDHWGGAAIAIGKPDTAMIIHKWDYDYYYTGNPAGVFWQTLQKNNTDYASYMTAPCVWRSYFQMTGYLLDNANKRLWIRPILPTSMGKKIINAPLINPRGWGTLNYDENANGDLFQTMSVAFDSVVTVKEIVLKNNTTVAEPGVSLKQNGAYLTGIAGKIEGSAFEKNIRVTLGTPLQLGPQGIDIKVYNGPVPTNKGIGCSYKVRYALALNSTRIAANLPIRYNVDAPGPVCMELINMNGAKIGTLMRANVSAGKHAFVWNGKVAKDSRVSSGMAIVRLTSSMRSISKVVFVGR